MCLEDFYKLNTLKSLRVKLGYSQKQAAELLGIHEVTLRNWERDSSNITFENIQKIENVYKTPQEYIFFGSNYALNEKIRNKYLLKCKIKNLNYKCDSLSQKKAKEGIEEIQKKLC